LRALLEKHEGWEVCGEASDGRECVDKALQLNPDVVIVDIGMPNLNGLDTTRQLLQHDPHFKVIVLTITDSDQVIREALDAGARGFVLKSDAARDLVSAVEALQNKRMFFTPRVNDLVLAGFLEKAQTVSRNEAPKRPTLTAREREIIQLLAAGYSSKEVAERYSTKLSVVIVATDNEQRALLLVLVHRTSVARVVQALADFSVTGADLVNRRVRAANPDVILVDIPVDNSQFALHVIELLHQEVPECAIFAIGSLSQPQVIVNAMRAGAREFIGRPTTAADLLDAFGRLKFGRSYPRIK
jgi:DNA-binding NarL/FixJ family response regulator